ncbi:MAG: hypothetical protein KDJ31_14480 [Candidatus Competibacteraceae bacterium]|nr:hypothetical protein [Candidatus Competibacteraceae bacterium]
MATKRWVFASVALVVVILVGVAMLAVAVAARVFAQTYSAFGSDLPALTALTIDLSRAGIPWLGAMSATVVLGYAIVRQPTWVPAVSDVVLAFAVLGLAFALLAFVEPIVLCGNYWPAWPAR